MKIRLFIAALSLLIVFFIQTAYSQNEITLKKKPVDAQKQTFKLILLPFYNYTDSSSKFLSDYIPEVIKKNLHLAYSVRIDDIDDIGQDLVRLNMTGKALYRRSMVTKLAEELQADAVIMGRYMLQGKTIKIDFSVYTLKNKKFFTGNSLDAQVDERLLQVVEKFCESRAAWIKSFVLADLLPEDADKDINAVQRVIKAVSSSSAGSLLKNRWILSVLLLVLFYILSLITAVFFEKVLLRYAEKTSTTVDTEIISQIKNPVKWIVFFTGARLAIAALSFRSAAAVFIANFILALIIAIVTYIMTRVADVFIRAWGKKVVEKLDARINDDLVPLFVKLSKIVIVIVGILMILARFEIDITPLIASLGIAGFAIGFAVKDSLSNIIGGIVLILDNSFVVGDKVSIDGETGVVLEVGLRNTMLRTFDNETIVFPNGELMNKKFKNFVLPDPMIRVTVPFSVAYGTNIDDVRYAVLGVLQNMESVLTDPAPAVEFIEMGDFSLNMLAKFWIPDYGSQYGKKLEAVALIYNVLNQHKIDIPFPTHTVYIKKESE